MEDREEEPLVFFVISDWGYPSDGLKDTARAMATLAETRPPQFVLALGDNFYWEGVETAEDASFKDYWQEVFLKYPNLNVPWKVVLGNHDYEGNPDAQLEFTNSSLNPRGKNGDPLWQLPAKHYKFSHNFNASHYVDFFAFDSNGAADYIVRGYPEKGAREATIAAKAWLEEELPKSKATWKIAFAHHPMYTLGRHHGMCGDCLREETFSHFRGKRMGFGMEKTFVDGGVDVYFGGHEHAMQYKHTKNIHHFVCGASGADNNRYYGGVDSQRSMDWRQTNMRLSGFVSVSLTSSKMTVEFLTNSLEVMHVVEIVKD
eukprot:TRINITY_DN6139_c0_g1_i1.p1 TRINITY_DN6139_c0_g1~~TRINITY_DN6139_c0_g1_i1.p1  ORF type:complete len:316 (+),score=56.18 TRINITY_DN6139_c0_g1_i1:319-1266(+)